MAKKDSKRTAEVAERVSRHAASEDATVKPGKVTRRAGGEVHQPNHSELSREEAGISLDTTKQKGVRRTAGQRPVRSQTDAANAKE